MNRHRDRPRQVLPHRRHRRPTRRPTMAPAPGDGADARPPQPSSRLARAGSPRDPSARCSRARLSRTGHGRCRTRRGRAHDRRRDPPWQQPGLRRTSARSSSDSTDAFDRASSGQPSLVLVAGEAGVGKSRLVAEFVRRDRGRPAAGRRSAAASTSARAACRTPRSSRRFRALARSLDPADASSGVRAVGGRARRARPGSPARSRCRRSTIRCRPVRPARPGCSTRSSPSSGGVATSGRSCSSLEDLHWADGSTRDLIRFLVRNLRDGAAPDRRDLPERRPPPAPPAACRSSPSWSARTASSASSSADSIATSSREQLGGHPRRAADAGARSTRCSSGPTGCRSTSRSSSRRIGRDGAALPSDAARHPRAPPGDAAHRRARASSARRPSSAVGSRTTASPPSSGIDDDAADRRACERRSRPGSSCRSTTATGRPTRSATPSCARRRTTTSSRPSGSRLHGRLADHLEPVDPDEAAPGSVGRRRLRRPRLPRPRSASGA